MLKGLNIERIDLEEKITSVVKDLESLVCLSETKYAYIYDNLPQIEREVSLNVREVEILLDYLVYNDHSSLGENQSVIVETLSRILLEFEEVTESFLNQELVSVLLRTFLDKSGGDRQSFSELINVSREVEETLSVLRDLALNSIIFSVRIGDQGAAFQILSDRINHVSLDLGEQFSGMKGTINRLSQWNEDFQKTLLEFVQYEEELKVKYQNKFKAEFDRIIEILQTVCCLLKDNLHKTNTAFGDVSKIMVMVQNQDIIRQNVENLAKCLEVLAEKSFSHRDDLREANLDFVVFAIKVVELSKTLMKNIEESLNESLFGLGALLTDMNQSMTDLESDKYFLDKLMVGDTGMSSEGVLGDVFSTVLGQVVDLLYIRKRVDSKSNLLLEERQNFVDLMEIVEKEFAVINKEAKNMKKMKILLQIELARINFENDVTLNSITNAVEQVIETIARNQQVFLQLRRHFLKNIDQFNAALSGTRDKLDFSANTLENAKSRLMLTRQLATGAVAASGHEMKEIFDRLKQPYEKLRDVDSVVMLLAAINDRLDEIYGSLLDSQAELFARYGVTAWEEKAEDLNILMDQFTCYVERKAMTEITGDEDSDIGSDNSGDIVLF